VTLATLRGVRHDRDCSTCAPAKAGVQEREALRFLGPERNTLLRSVLGPGLRRGTAMKQLNPFPLVAMLIVVVFLIVWML
jgi:hypothetical protein